MLVFFFFNDTATTEIYTLSLHDALPILADQRRDAAHQAEEGRDLDRARPVRQHHRGGREIGEAGGGGARAGEIDRKSTRLNSRHAKISYAAFCFKKKKNHSSNKTLFLSV